MSKRDHFARVAVTLPPGILKAADELATRLDRSRSWVVAEAIRQLAAAHGDERGILHASRRAQLERDAALSPTARVLEGEEIVMVGPPSAHSAPPRTFQSFDAFLDWRRSGGGT
jgi:predicted transcriptional regulator